MASRHKELPAELEVNNNMFAHSMSTPSPGPPPELTFVPTATPEVTTRCAISPGGFFGEFTGDSVSVNYLYQVETVPSESALDPDIVNSVEMSVLNSLLPQLFEQACGISTDISKRTIRRRRLELLGASTQPPDEPLVGVACSGQLSGDSSCFVVDGELTLFGDDQEELEGSVESSRVVIRDEMNSGAYNDIDDRVINITFRNGTFPGNGGNTVTGNGEDDSDDGSRVPAYGWVIIALAPIVLCAAFVYYKRRADERKRGAFPIATSSEDIIPYEDPVLGLEVSTPEVTTIAENTSPLAPVADSGQESSERDGNSSSGEGIGIASRPTQSSELDYIAATSEPEEPDAWEKFPLT